jgi:hypothetical protein
MIGSQHDLVRKPIPALSNRITHHEPIFAAGWRPNIRPSSM